MTTTKAKLTIKNCDFVRPCHAEWGKLERTQYFKDIRHCSECKKQVHLVKSDSDLALAIHLEYCVAIPIHLIEKSVNIDADIANYNDKSKWTTTHLLGAVQLPTKRTKFVGSRMAPNFTLEGNAVPNIVHHLRRRVTNSVRRQYADIVECAKKYLETGTPMPSRHELIEMFGVKKVKWNTQPDYRKPAVWIELDHALMPRWNYTNPDHISVFVSWMRSDDPYDRHKAMAALRNQIGAWEGNEYHHDVMLAIDRMILARHKDEVFKEVELPVGAARKDKYSWAFD
jgi:hypothetical protein